MANLCLFTENFPYKNGEVFLQEEIIFLSKKFEKIIIFPSEISSKKEFALPKNVEVCELDLPVKTSPRKIISNYFPLVLGYFAFEIIFSKHRLKYISQFKFNLFRLLGYIQEAEVLRNKLNELSLSGSICYTYWFNQHTTRLLLLKKMGIPGIKVISRVHLYDFEEEFSKNGYLPFRYKEMQLIDKVIPISEYARNYLIKLFNNKKITTIHRLGAPSKSINYGGISKEYVIVSCSVLSWYKRPELLVDVIASLDVPVHWIHFGDGPMREQFIAKAQNLPPHVKLDYRGRVSNEEILQFYRENPVDALLNVSIYEGIPYSMMEAIASGIPVIGCNVCGVPEIVTEQTGLLLPAVEEPKQIALLVSEFLSSHARNHSFRQGVKAFGKQFYDAEMNYSEFIQTQLCVE